MAVPFLALATLLLSALASAGPPADAAALAKKLKSKDVYDRLEAVETIRTEGVEDQEELLLGALKDKDWEVREFAARALGERGGDDSVKPLVAAALEGPARRVRIAAAQSLIHLDLAEAATAIGKRVGGKLGEPACEALSELALAPPERFAIASDAIRKGIRRGLSSDESLVRKAAARGLVALPSAERAATLQKLSYDADLGVAAAALDGVIRSPGPECMEPLLVGLRRDDLNDVIERRLQAAVVAVVRMSDAGEAAETAATPVADALDQGPSGKVAARLARVLGILATPPARTEAVEDAEKKDESAEDPRLVRAVWALEKLEPALKHEDEAARSAAVHALGRIRTDAALDRAAASTAADVSARVRLHALRAVTATRDPATHEPTLNLACARLEYDEDARVREAAAVALGARGADGAVGTLEKGLKDKDWSVAVCSAVSLGKTRSADALPSLKNLFAKSKDWRLRGAAIVGLGRLQHNEAIPTLIEALDEKETAVARTAFEFLRRLTSESVKSTSSAWTKWWAANGPDYTFIDREEEARKAKKFGYAPDLKGVYEGLDVVVLQSRGDHIEKLLSKLEIEHRLTRGAQVPKAELHPFAVFVSNCTGEINAKDVDQLTWFVRVGGYMFCSCWALHHTAELVYPGVVRKLPTMGEVLDHVESESCPTDSSYLDGVFDGITRPIYVLYGAHLIEVLDPERVEVLIDSPDCATRWGGGNLACWFTAGHGVILDSANHFDLQGLEKAPGLSSADDRRSYAVDHMGLGYEELRELDAAKVWKSGSKANKAARDLSAFRFITNFVRDKRKTDP